MFDKPYEVIHLENHKDERGSLFEILRFKDNKIPGEGYIYSFTINPGQRRADHYHKIKQEWFSCISGKVTVLIEDKDGTQSKIILDAANPAVVYCSPYTAHALYNESEEVAVVVSYGSPQHDPNNPDTFKKFINFS